MNFLAREWILALGLTLLFASASDAQTPPQLVSGSQRKVTDATGTTFYATWIANDSSGSVRARFFYQVSGKSEQSVEAKPNPIKGIQAVKVSAKVPGLTRATEFQWRASAGGGANGTITVPDRGSDPDHPLPGLLSVALVTPNTYLGVCLGNGGQPAGFGKVSLSAGGILSGSLELFGTTYRFTGPFGDDGRLVISPVPKAKTAPTFLVTFSSDLIVGRISFTIDGSSAAPPFGFLSGLLAPTNPAFTTKNPTPLAGRYTILLPVDLAHRGDPAFPLGDGYATMVVAPNGSVKFVGKLPDGATISIGALFDIENKVPVFAPLYAGTADYLAGNFYFSSNSEPSPALGGLHWSKPGPLGINRPYDAGFETDIAALASPYPGLPGPALAAVYLVSENANSIVGKSVSVAAKGGAATIAPAGADGLALKLAAKTGLVTGSVNVAGAKAPVFGILNLALARFGGFYLANGKSNLLTTVFPRNGTVYQATGLPLAIPDNDSTGVTSNIAVNQPGTILNCRLSLKITHTYSGDLTITLTSPTGTPMTILKSTGDFGLNVSFIDFSIPPVLGEAASGVWQLRVVDELSGDTGTLDSWSLEIFTE